MVLTVGSDCLSVSFTLKGYIGVLVLTFPVLFEDIPAVVQVLIDGSLIHPLKGVLEELPVSFGIPTSLDKH